ncbi:MAG: hypothetical protein N3F66_04335 [Spirochaetes bacterium]|nr:hypothetical protein [Spirochaetota bacterium]
MRYVFLIVFIMVCQLPVYADMPVDVVIINTSIQTPMIQALSSITKDAVKEAFTSCRQLVPADVESFYSMTGSPSAGDITGTAHLYGVSLLVYMRVFLVGPVYYGELSFVPLDDTTPFKEETITVQATVAKNIPLKIKREIIRRHTDVLQCTVKIKVDAHTYIIDAGQWHGLEVKTYTLNNGKKCEVKVLHRYSALVRLEDEYTVGDKLSLSSTVSRKKLLDALTSAIHENVVYEYSGKKLLKGDSDSKRAVESCCIVNPFGNILLPGYGAYLATHYLGFTHSEPDWWGVYAGAFTVIGQLLLVPALGNGKVNFFPWIKDHDKTDALYHLHWYVWATLPVTYTVAFFNQLAYAYQKQRLLPPFFDERNVTALLISAIVPGGGLFYKGHRLYGYGYWLSEFTLGGLLAYSFQDTSKRSLWAGMIAGIKLVELFHAWIASPAYTVYSYELSHTTVPINIGIGGFSSDVCFYAYFSKNY